MRTNPNARMLLISWYTSHGTRGGSACTTEVVVAIHQLLLLLLTLSVRIEFRQVLSILQLLLVVGLLGVLLARILLLLLTAIRAHLALILVTSSVWQLVWRLLLLPIDGRDKLLSKRATWLEATSSGLWAY